MTNIIVHGLVSNKYITQGYHGAAPIVTPPPSPGGKPTTFIQHKPSQFWQLIKYYLEMKQHA